MGRLWCLAGVLLFAGAAFAQQLRPEMVLLERVRTRAARNLTKLPDYTCLQTIERTIRPAPARRWELIDMVRVEVALVDGKELFSWPGAGQFSDQPITEMVTGGAIGNGDFALFARSVFMTRDPVFDFTGERMVEGRRTYRWDFRVPQLRSGYTLTVQPHRAVVGYRGSFWVDAGTLDLIRLEVRAEDIPPVMELRDAGTSVEYARINIGGEPFLLPQTSELNLTDVGGTESRNRSQFTRCRQYAGESKLTFAEVDESSVQSQPQIAAADLPPKVALETTLETPIVSGETAVGDPVTATVRKAVKKDGQVIVPKGAILHGRITLLRRQQTAQPGWAVGIHLFAAEWPGARARMNASLESAPALVGAPSLGRPSQFGRPDDLGRLYIALPGSVFFVKGATLDLRRGILMHWRTENVRNEDQK